MGDDFLGDRRKGLEEEFFRQQETALLARKRADEEQHAARAALAAGSHIKDGALLDQLVAFGINADTLTALSLVPLVEVAWADGTVDAPERRAILEAARAAGLAEASAGYQLLANCLSAKPRPQLRELWLGYVRSACATLSPSERAAFKAELLQQAATVAQAAGGFLGMGSKISSQEAAVLTEIERAFDE